MYDYSMEFESKIKNLTLKQKLNQLFIAGFEGDNPNSCKLFQELLKNGLGGVIFFTQNIQSKKQFKEIINLINKNALIPPFMSIDQEGGRVERTENIHNGKKYLSAKYAAEKGIDFLIKQTDEMSKELKEFGINMDFAPVLDVNTNENNPIIGERAYSNKTEEVIKFSKPVIESYIKSSIIPVGKHFPGHGEANLDSHLKLPTIDLSIEELEKTHIEPFKQAIIQKIPAIMVAHVHYPCFDKEKIPASMSQNVIGEYLIKKLNYDGVIISDDMVMGAVQGFSSLEACIRAINSGITMFIFRNTDKNVINLIDALEKAILDKRIDENLINSNLKKIINLKHSFKLTNLNKNA